MLHLFRKIRRSLVENSSGKYFLYALGEIALLVIGILIALQINNWREKVKNQEWERYYLERISEDIEGDILEIDVTLSRNYERIIAANTLIKQLEREDYLDKHRNVFSAREINFLEQLKEHQPELDSVYAARDLGFIIRKLGDYRKIELRNYTYAELMSNGRFEVIANDTLREMISSYYWQIDDFSSSQAYLESIHAQYIEHMAKEKIPIAKNFAGTFQDYVSDQGITSAVIENLIYVMIRVQSLYGGPLVRRAEELLHAIDTYIKEN